MHRSDHLNSRVKYDFEEEKITPLNQEACLYLAYKAMLTDKPDLASEYLVKSQSLQGSSLLELKEGLKTIECLILLKNKDYENAEKKIATLEKVPALTKPKTILEEKTYLMYRRIRGASIQLRAGLPLLKEFNSLANSHMLSARKYEALKSKWRVQLTASEYGYMYVTKYPFPDMPLN